MILPNVTLDFFLLGAAAILLIGFLGRAIARNTSVPHIVWLMVFGMLFIPIFNFVPQSRLLSVIPFVSSVVILIFMFNAGLNINLHKLLREASRVTIVGIVNFVAAAAAVFFAMFLLGYGIMLSSLTGIIVGSIGSTVIPYVWQNALHRNKNKDLLVLESAISEPLSIILVLVIISMILINNYQISFLATTLVSEFSIAIVIGAIFAFAWIPAMSFFQRYKYEYSYAASLALVFIVYTIVQDLGGSGPIAALMFGLVIANGEEIYRGLNYRHSHSFTLSKESKSFHDLITFFTTSFFFVYFGGLITPSDYYYFLLGIIIGLVLLLARIASTHLALFKSEFSDGDKSLISYMVSRGTGTAVVAMLPISYGILGLPFLDIIFMAILTTIVMNSLLTANYKIAPLTSAS